jgi:hypothetical protein
MVAISQKRSTVDQRAERPAHPHVSGRQAFVAYRKNSYRMLDLRSIGPAADLFQHFTASAQYPIPTAFWSPSRIAASTLDGEMMPQLGDFPHRPDVPVTCRSTLLRWSFAFVRKHIIN